ncbi:MAG: formylglycine-generating enzyme family protein [Candidatus Competibacteraceae bacterium]|nr:formylglycine-generating enzyme family protein [Candidatus Competibacteraceae bacterium]
MNEVEGGCFNMGSPPAERDRSSDESVHQACVKDFWIGKTEVTNSQYRRFKPTPMTADPSRAGHSLNGNAQPAVNLTWNDAQAFVEWLSWETGAGKRFRLPTEAEWEYTARAGATTRYYWGNDIDPRHANFSDRNDPTGAAIGNLDDGQAVTAPVGTYLPNALGLHDMAGNVWEWTCSEYDPNYGGQEQRCSSRRSNEGQRTVRGGSWNNGPGDLRAAKRLPRQPGHRDAMTGFRVLLEGE